jgi:type 1 glutamine amidotransferase
MNNVNAVLVWVVLAMVIVFSGAAVAEENMNVLVVTGGHGYEQEPFEAMFKSFDGLNCTFVALKDHSEIFEDISDWRYDVLVLYNMSQKISEKRQQNFLKLLDDGVGLVVLHHAIAAFSDWREYRKIIGAKYWLEDTVEDGVEHKKCTWKEGVDMLLHVEDSTHPIMADITDFTIHDEVYKGYDLQPDNHLLLSCGLPNSQKEVGWTRTYGKAKVCLIQPGHGPEAHGNENYRRLVRQAIAWVAPE